MAFEFITHSAAFQRLDSSIKGKTLIARYKRIVFRILKVLVSDITWQKMQYKKYYGRKLNLSAPEHFPDKVLYLKLFYKNPLLHVCADKHFVQDYLRALGLEDILIPELGIYDNGDEIDFDALPDKFIIKRTQGSGGNLIIDQRSPEFNKKEIVRYLNELVKMDYYTVGREFGYQGVKSKLQAQQLLVNHEGATIEDYKFYCFEGKLKYYMVSYGEYENRVRNHKFDANDHSIDAHFKKKETVSAAEIKLPDNIGEMKRIVEKLAAPFPHVRVDLYNVDGKIYFGELTFYSSGGFIKVYDQDYDREIASWIDLGKYKDDMFFPKFAGQYKTALHGKIQN